MKIKSSLSQNKFNDPQDVLAVKTALSQLGYYDVPNYGMTSYPDMAMFHGIKQLQQDLGLKEDGVIKPNGETAAGIKAALGKSPIQRCTECGGPHGGSKGSLCPSCDAKK